MNWSSILALILALSLTPRTNADVNLREGRAVRFASAGEGAEILDRKDDFIQRLSAFDRAARMKTDRSISEDEFLRFLKGNVLTWNGSEKAKVEAAIVRIRPALDALPLSLPKIVNPVKTTGAEEGRAFYTRDTAIIMPEKEINEGDSGLLERTIANELFHILSRGNPALREKLYKSIGFTKCGEVEFPPKLRSRKITNPDAPRNDLAISVRIHGEEVHAVPILFSKAAKYDVNRAGEFFNYLQLSLLQVPGISTAQPVLGAPRRGLQILRAGWAQYKLPHSPGGNFGRQFCLADPGRTQRAVARNSRENEAHSGAEITATHIVVIGSEESPTGNSAGNFNPRITRL